MERDDTSGQHEKMVQLLDEMLAECYQLNDEAASLRKIENWHAKCQGKLAKVFSHRPDFLEHWKSIDFEWDDRHSFYIAFERNNPYRLAIEDNEDYIDEYDHPDAFADFCWHRIKWCREALLQYIAVNAGEPIDNQFGSASATDVPFEGLIQPRPGIPDFGFIEDDSVTIMLKDRLEQAIRCNENRLYLAAIVLLGSTLEGMLLGLVKEQGKEPIISPHAPKKITKDSLKILDSFAKKVITRLNGHSDDISTIVEEMKTDASQDVKPINDWSFDELINYAHTVGWIEEEAKMWAKELQDWRNLVHPAVHLKKETVAKQNKRKQGSLDSNHFFRGYTAIHKCVGDLNRRYEIPKDDEQNGTADIDELPST